jgi:hypothetical protein
MQAVTPTVVEPPVVRSALKSFVRVNRREKTTSADWVQVPPTLVSSTTLDMTKPRTE